MKNRSGSFAPSLLLVAVLFTGDAMAVQEDASKAKESAVQPLSEKELADLVKKADSRNFADREAATMRMWKAGREIESPLSKIQGETNSPELRLRIQQVLEKFKYGIYPDTPADIIALVNQFRNGDHEDRQSAVMELSDKNRFNLAMRLIRTLKDPDARNSLSNSFASAIDEKIEPLILGGKHKEAGALLYSCAVNRERMIDYAVYASLEGELAKATKKQQLEFEKSLDPISGELLYWLLRAEGKFNEAHAVAGELNRPKLAREVSILDGDLPKFIDASADLGMNIIQSHCFSLARDRLTGEQEKADATVKVIQNYAEEFEKEYLDCALALGWNGYVEEAFAITEARNIPQVCLWHIAGDNIAKAMTTIGLAADESDPAAISGAIGRELWKTEDFNEQSRWVAVASEFAKLFGKSKKAESLFDLVFQNALAIEENLAREDNLVLYVIGNETQRGLLSQARTHSLAAMKAGAEQDDVLKWLFPGQRAVAGIWFDLIDKKFPDAGRHQIFEWMQWLLIPELTNPEGDQLAKVKEIISLAEEHWLDPKAAPNARIGLNAPLGGLNSRTVLASICMQHEMWDRAIGHLLEDHSEAEWKNVVKAGEISAYLKRWEQTRNYYKQAWEMDQPNRENLYHNLFLYGWAEGKCGDLEAGERMMRSARLLMRGNLANRISFADDRLMSLGLHAWAEEEAELVYRLSDPLGEPLGIENAKAADVLGTLLARKDPERAVLLTERRLLLEMDSNISNTLNFLSFLNLLYGAETRAALARKDGRAAVDSMKKALAYAPSNSSAIEDAFADLVALDMEKEAKALFDGIHEEASALVRRFPEYGQFHNNLAWLNSRCGQNLDEALKHAEIAVKMQPRNAAYLDTLAEVHFARGDVEKAIEESDKCIDIIPADAQIREQNARFRAGLGKKGS